MEVINIKHYDKDISKVSEKHGDNWVYIGRSIPTYGLHASPLANPFSSDKYASATYSRDPMASYKKWLWDKIKSYDYDVLNALLDLTLDTKLVCWCKPSPCHGDIIASAYNYVTGKISEGGYIPIRVALSIQQPWAWLIANGHKDVENRSWATRKTGWVLIHAGKKIDKSAYQFLDENHPHIQLPQQGDLPRGGLVGLMRITGCVQESTSPWFFGPYGFTIDKALPMSLVPVAGKLKFFNVNIKTTT